MKKFLLGFGFLFILLFFYQGKAQESCINYIQFGDSGYERRNFLFYDNFNNNYGAWVEVDSDSMVIKIKNGKLTMGSGDLDSGFVLNYINTFIDESRDFTIKTATKKEVQDTVNTSNYGFIWGFKDSANFNIMIVNSGGCFMIGKTENMESEYLSEWIYFTNSTFFNRLKIKKKKEKIHFYVNGKKRHSIDYIPSFGTKVGFLNFTNNNLMVNYLKIKQK